MSAIEAVIFDIGNVLIRWQPEMFYDRVIGADRRRALFAEVDLHGMNDGIDAGADFRDTVYGTAEAFPQWRDESRLWHDNWLEIAAPAIETTPEIIRALKARGVTTFALSNIGAECFDLAAAHYPFLREIDLPFVSGSLGLVKPDPAIYEAVERMSGLPPETLYFIDDKAENIAAATDRGWQTHHFTSGDRLFADLVARSVLEPDDLSP